MSMAEESPRAKLHRALFYDHGGQDVFRFADARLTLQDDPYLPRMLDELLRLVSSWDWLMAILAERYPPDVFSGESADPGPQIVVLVRQIERLHQEVGATDQLNEQLGAAVVEIGLAAGCPAGMSAEAIRAAVERLTAEVRRG